VRLFPNYREKERDFYQRTGFHPIMHTLVMHEDLHARHPWIAESLFKACEESKKLAIRNMRYSGAQKMMLPWLYDEIAEMDQLMGQNPWPYGLKANRPILTAFMRYLVDQHFLPEPTSIDELFTPIVQWTE
jgi:4,5-dihydroxyphthalate decarboxylase